MQKFACALALIAAVPAMPAPVAAPGLSPESLEALRAVDLRMARIAYRLTTANAALCTDLAPTPGWMLHTLSQYDAVTRPAARQVFGFAAPVAVETVVPDAPAARAGIAANDGLAAIDGKPIGGAGEATRASTSARDAVLAQIAAEPAGAPLSVEIVRDGRRRAATIAVKPGCRSAFEVLLGPAMTAQSDGRIVQIGVRFFERYDDDQVAVIVAHELAHTILRHRARMEAAGIKFGLLAEFGRNGRINRLVEDQADLLGMHLLRNAGYDPASAPRFWRDHGGDIDGGFFRSRTHPSSSARAKALEAELARIPAGAPRPYVPPILAERDRPLQ